MSRKRPTMPTTNVVLQEQVAEKAIDEVKVDAVANQPVGVSETASQPEPEPENEGTSDLEDKDESESVPELVSSEIPSDLQAAVDYVKKFVNDYVEKMNVRKSMNSVDGHRHNDELLYYVNTIVNDPDHEAFKLKWQVLVSMFASGKPELSSDFVNRFAEMWPNEKKYYTYVNLMNILLISAREGLNNIPKIRRSIDFDKSLTGFVTDQGRKNITQFYQR